MDRISHLPDETLSKILSFLPTKDVMPTMLLSKRWKFLWMLVPRLECDDSTHFGESEYWGYAEVDYGRFLRFVDRSLLSREGQVLQCLDLKVDRRCNDGDVVMWVGTAVRRGLMELKLISSSYNCIMTPKSFYTCETLVLLNLRGVGLDVPDLVSLRSLKTLSLKSIKCYNTSCLVRLLSSCPVLEDLVIEGIYHESGLIFKIVVPSLKRLSLLDDSGSTGLVIDAPLLKYLHIVDRSGSLSFGETINTNEVTEANVEVILSRPEKLLHSLASVQHLRICLSASEVVYPVGSCFHSLKHLEVCTCKSEWLGLFMQLLENSPSLKVIKINQNFQRHPVTNPRPQWNQPGSVPRCLSTSLETLEWIAYEGTHDEKELSAYILKTAVCLKKASFSAKSYDPKHKLQILQDLSFSRRVSSTCELAFK